MPNAEYHYAAGDIVKWSGIRRCGGAMHMGQYAAQNIHLQMLRDTTGEEPAAWKELNVFPPMIGLAVAKKAVVYDPDEGTSDGEHLLKSYFGQDLGHQSKCSPPSHFRISRRGKKELRLNYLLQFAGTTWAWAASSSPRHRRNGRNGYEENQPDNGLERVLLYHQRLNFQKVFLSQHHMLQVASLQLRRSRGRRG